MHRGIHKLLPLVVVALLAIGGCGGGKSETDAGTSASGSQTGPETLSQEGHKGVTVVNTTGLPSLPKSYGSVLIDAKEFTLYEFSRDKGTTPSCYGACAKTWRPLLTKGMPLVGFGAFESELRTTKRKDGTTQVTYAGHPVYSYVGDKKRFEANGNGVQAFGGKWLAVKDPLAPPDEVTPQPKTPRKKGQPVRPSESSGWPEAYTKENTGVDGPALIKVRNVKGIGAVLVDSKGHTLYEYAKDKGGTPTCYGGCVTAWPPFVTEGTPRVTGGAMASALGTTKRKDGAIQVTYNGHPLYTYVQDKEPGEVNSNNYEGYGGRWYALSPNGERAKP